MMDDPRQKILDETMASLDAALGSPKLSSQRRQMQGRKGRYSTGGNTSKYISELLDCSTILPPTEITRNARETLEQSIMQGDITAPVSGYFQNETILDKTSAAILAQDDPGIKSAQVLFSEFVSIFVSHSSTDIWSEISSYERVCCQQAEALKKLIRKVPKHHSSFSKTQNMTMRLYGERNTWRLLASLFRERLADNMEGTQDILQEEQPNKSDKTIISNLYEESDTIREAQIVIDWLEKNAHDDYEGKYFDRVEYFGNTHIAWENTLRTKKNLELSRKSDHNVLKSLDPDAPLREGTPLHDLDKEEDDRLVQCMFACVRAGQLSDAQDLCAKSGQHWRAATLEGWKLHHDPNTFIKAGGFSDREPIKGNPYRDVWKSIAFGAASDSRLGTYERAIYGSLCGHLPSMLTVCSNWEDTLWAHMKTLVDQRVEEKLRENSSHLRTMCRLPKEYPEEKLTLPSIFNQLDAISPTAANSYHLLQKYLILNDINGLVSNATEWLLAGPVDSHLLRCISHLILVLRRIWTIPSDLHEQVTNILHACVKEAMERGDVEQVAWYTSTLPVWLQVRTYSGFLTNISDERHRKHALSLADLVGLDTDAIITTVVANIRLTPPANVPETITPETSPEDKILLAAIDWLLYDENQRGEAVRQGNAIIRQLLIKRKVHAAKQLFNKIPFNSVDLIYKSSEKETGSKDLPNHLENRVKEHLCYRAFFTGQDVFSEWFEHFYQKRPKEPKGVMGDSFPEQLKHEQAMRVYEMENERWNTQMESISKKALERLTEVILFPEGGWLVDIQAPLSHADSMEVTEGEGSPAPLWECIGGRPADMKEDEWELYSHLDSEMASREPCRQHQMETLRALFIPQACSLLQNIQSSMEKHKESIQLADLIASEKHQLYKCFSVVEMQRFLFKLQESSKALLDKNFDALGYPIN